MWNLYQLSTENMFEKKILVKYLLLNTVGLLTLQPPLFIIIRAFYLRLVITFDISMVSNVVINITLLRIDKPACSVTARTKTCS